MHKIVAAALLAIALTGCGAPQTQTAASTAHAAVEAQAAGKAAIKKAAIEAVTADVKKAHLAVAKATVKSVKLEETVLGFAQKFVAVVVTTANNPLTTEERTYEVTGIYNPTNKKSPATVSKVELTQTR